MFEAVLYEVEAGVATLTLNRPEKYNAINDQLTSDLYAAFKRAEADASARAVVLTGAGRGFCAGQDLGDRLALDESLRLADSVRERYNLLIAKMHAMPIPVIAAVNGACAGAGFGLALACDLRFAADDAKFTMAFSRIGLVPDSGTSYFLSRLVGVGRALELAWTGDIFTADQAQQWGIVNRLLPADELLASTRAFATQLASGPTVAYRLTKRLIHENFSATLPQALEREAEFQDIAGRTADFREGVRAFAEKKTPEFRGE